MIKEIFATGSDVNTAIDSGCLLLGIDRADAQFEIIDLPRKSFLGLKKLPAKVRVYLELPDPAPARPARPAAQQPAQPAARPAQNPAPKAAQPAAAQPAQPAAAQPAQPAAAPAADAAAQPGEGKPKRRRDRHRKKGPKPEGFSEAAGQPLPAEEPRVEIEPTEEMRVKAERAHGYVSGILAQMGFSEIEITPFFYEENVRLQLGGERLGSVIGRRGETLDALQYLASLVANRGEGSYLRINIDSGNYREKRERTLETLARKLASNAVKSGHSITLEPMNPYERRIIHGTVSAMKGVTSSSIGVEPNRKVVITPDGSVPPSAEAERSFSGERTGERTGSRGGRGHGGHGGRGGERPAGDRGARPERGERGGRRDDPPAIGGPVRREAQPERPERSLEEKALTETSRLYGKIDL